MKTLFLLEGRHRFFGADGGAGVRFVPTCRSRFIAEKAGVRFFFRGNCGRVCFYSSDFQKLNAYADDPLDPLIFSFLVMAERPDFYNYTELPDIPAGHLLVGTNRQGQNDLSIHSGKPLGPSSLVDASLLMAEGVLTGDELASCPVALLYLDYSGKNGRDLLQGALEGIPQAYAIYLGSRKTYWRYFIACDDDPEHLMVEDVDGRVSFGAAGVMKIGTRQQYARFVSDRPLALQWKGKASFQLKRKRDGRYKTLLKVLPNAPSDYLHSMEINGRRVFVSDIFVNHYVYGRRTWAK